MYRSICGVAEQLWITLNLNAHLRISHRIPWSNITIHVYVCLYVNEKRKPCECERNGGMTCADGGRTETISKNGTGHRFLTETAWYRGHKSRHSLFNGSGEYELVWAERLNISILKWINFPLFRYHQLYGRKAASATIKKMENCAKNNRPIAG